MNINKIDDVNLLVVEINKINKSDWQGHQVSAAGLEKFLENNQSVFGKYYQNPTLGQSLGALADRISKAYDKETAKRLTGLMGSYQKMTLPSDIVYKVMRDTMTFLPHAPVSKEWNAISISAKAARVNSNHLPLGKKLGLKTTREAVRFAVEAGPELRYLDLSKFKRLSDEDLALIVRACPNLEVLILSNAKVTGQGLKVLGNLKSLQTLALLGCDKLEALPEEFKQLKQLETLHLIAGKEMKRFPAAICHLANLKELNVAGNRNFVQLPNTMGNLQKLQTLDLSNCPITTLPEELGALPLLREITLVRCSQLRELPPCPNVQILNIKDCDKLEVLPAFPGLTNLNLMSCEHLSAWPAHLKEMKNLQQIKVKECPHLPPLAA